MDFNRFIFYGEWKRRNDSDMNDKMYQMAGTSI